MPTMQPSIEATSALGALAFYVGLNLLILLWLTVQTGRVRMREKVMMGDGGNAALIRVMRGHANAVEVIPPTLIALLVLALLGTPPSGIHVLGIMLTLGRFLHALHFTSSDAPRWQRAAGFGLSALAMIAATLWALWAGLTALL